MNNSSGANRILIITPVRNEEKFFPKTIESILSQSLKPARWIIVDDGSSDDTYKIAKSAAQNHEWITVLKRVDRGQRTLGGGVVEVIYEGLNMASNEFFGYIWIIPGDIIVKPYYLERLLEKFKEDPLLGIAGGWIKGEKPMPFAPIGAARLYRLHCFQDIGGFVFSLGWDTVDVYEAMRKGWKTKTFWDEVFRIDHLRKMGSSYKGLLRGYFRGGQASYLINYHPMYFLATVLKRSTHYPYIILGGALFYGYVKSWLTRAPRHGDGEFRKFVRRFQLRLLLKTLNPFQK